MTKYIVKNRIAEHLAIKARRDGVAHITQQEIMAATGLPQQTVSTHIRNLVSRVEFRVIAIWCEYLDITPDQFLTWVAVEDDSEEEDPECKTPLMTVA